MNFFGFTDNIKRRLCRYVLQLYLGPFLREKLEIDQLSIDLYSGAGHVHNVNLDVEVINKSIQQLNVPVELLEGFVESISVIIPWKSIFSESCEIKVKGIRLVLQPKYMSDTDLVHMTDSLYNSLKSMTASMQLAEECLNNTEKEPEGQRFKGLETFAKEIDNVIRRIKLELGDISICFEHDASLAKFGVGIEINLKHFEYFDEDVDIENKYASQNHKSSDPFVENVAFSCKQFRVSGVTISMYQFKKTKCTVPLQSVFSYDSIMSNPVTIAKLFGEQQLKIRIKQNDQLSGPKFDSELYLGDCAVFLIPKQVSLLMDFLDGFMSPSSNDSNYTADSFPSSMSPIVQHNLHHYNDNRNIDTNHFNSLELSPPKVPPIKSKVVQFTPLNIGDLSSSETFKSTVEHFEHCNLNDTTQVPHHQKKSVGDGSDDSSILKMLRCQIKLVSLVANVLHTDPYACNLNTSNIDSSPSLTDGFVDQDPHFYLSKLVSRFFTEIENIYLKFSSHDLFCSRSLFADVLNGHDHLHLLLGPFHLEFDRNFANDKSFLSSSVAYASVGNAELLECLFYEDDSITCVELLSFPKLLSKGPKSLYSSAFVGQAITISLTLMDKAELSRISINVKLADCTSEVDISITDRLADLISSFSAERYYQTSSSNNDVYPSSYSDDAMFQKALADGSEAKLKKFEISFSSSLLHLDFRFPIPDLQPETSKRPWFKRMLRDEVLQIDAKDFISNIDICCSGEVNQYSDQHKSVKCKFREMSAYYSEKPEINQQLFLKACQCDDQADNDFDWPFLEIRFQEVKESTHLGNNVSERANSNSEEYIFSYDAFDVSNKDSAPLFNSCYEPSVPKRPSPFSQRKVVRNCEEMILPGDDEEILKFVEHASSTSKFNITVNFPNIKLFVPSKSFIESLYNRLNNDLMLWTPVAPQPNLPSKKDNTFIPARLDCESQFFSAKNNFETINDEDDALIQESFMSDDDDESRMSYVSRDSKPFQKTFENLQNQSLLSLSLNINKGEVSVCSDISSNKDSTLGQLFIELKNGSLFVVSQYLGNPKLDYLCVQVDTCNLSHKVGLFPFQVVNDVADNSHLDSLIYPLNDGIECAFANRGLSVLSQIPKMLTAVFKFELDEKQTKNGVQSLKHCLVAVLMRSVVYKHQFLPVGHSFFEQIMDVIDINDIEISGYQPPTILTEIHFHLSDCAIDYKPQHLNSRVVATISSFDLSSNVTANSPISILQMMMDNVNLFISNYYTSNTVDLRQNFVNVFSIALLELCLKLSNEIGSDKTKLEFPDFELIVSNSHIQMKTCADSCALFTTLIRYIAQDGDFAESEFEYEINDTLSCKNGSATDEETSVKTPELLNEKDPDSIKVSYEQHLEGLIADATVELKHDYSEINACTDSGNVSDSCKYENESKCFDDFVDCDDGFCIIDELDTEIDGNSEPKVEYLLADKDSKVVVIDNYFAPVNRRTDYLKAPDHFPVPVMRYTVRELTFVCYIYGGNDFPEIDAINKISKDKKNSGSKLAFDNKIGGVNRNHKLLLQLNLTKSRFQHEIYNPTDPFESRTVFSVLNFKISDLCEGSYANHFLNLYHNESSPKQSNANMLQIKVLLERSEQHKDSECRLKISLQPLVLTIDQDTLVFITEFFTSLSELISENAENTCFDDGSTYGTAVSTFAEPRLKIQDFHDSKNVAVDVNQSDVVRPLFINEFIFSPAVPIVLSYQPKHINIEQGKVTGLIMGLGRLNCSKLTLQKIVHRHGLLGVDKLINFALNTWASDIRNNQLPSILGGVGPMHSFVKFFQGFRDLIWLPVEQYKRDGRIVRGLQRGTASFGTSTSMAILELSNRVVGFVQSTAEMVCDIVSPADLHKHRQRYLNSWRGLEKHARRKRQPSDFREGLNNAVSVVHHGVTDTAYSIALVAQKEHERKGLTGAVGGVIRHIPLTLVRPVVIASEATSNVLSGMRNQILPDAKREDEEKWRNYQNEP